MNTTNLLVNLIFPTASLVVPNYFIYQEIKKSKVKTFFVPVILTQLSRQVFFVQEKYLTAACEDITHKELKI